MSHQRAAGSSQNLADGSHRLNLQIFPLFLVLIVFVYL